jgi:hypothetical protein
MSDRLLLVDYENVQSLDVATIPPDVRVHVVLGAKQKPIVAKVQAKLEPLGDRATVNRIQTLAPNAVDFCIAFYLGDELSRRPETHCVILSKDKKGFDPLVAHLTKERGLKVRRVNAQKEAFAAPPQKKKSKAAPKKSTPAANAHFERLVGLLRDDKVRPKKRKGLLGRLKSWFPALDVKRRESLLQWLVDQGHVSEAEGVVTYRI